MSPIKHLPQNNDSGLSPSSCFFCVACRYPTDEELLTLFTALRIQHRHEGLIRDSVTKNRAQFRPGEDDIHIRKTDVRPLMKICIGWIWSQAYNASIGRGIWFSKMRVGS